MSRSRRELLAASVILPTLIAATTSPAAAQTQDGVSAPWLRSLSGRWNVSQSRYDGPGSEPTALPPAVAERRAPPGGGFLIEEMSPREARAEGAFTRVALLNFNIVDRVFEYASMDSRAPQQMSYRSQPTTMDEAGSLRLQGGTFVAEAWGAFRNTAMEYRLELSALSGDSQILQLFLRPLTRAPSEEFLAFDYVYSRAG